MKVLNLSENVSKPDEFGPNLRQSLIQGSLASVYISFAVRNNVTQYVKTSATDETLGVCFRVVFIDIISQRSSTRFRRKLLIELLLRGIKK